MCFLSLGLLGFYFPFYFSSFIEVDSQELQFGAEEVHFTVKLKEVDSIQLDLFCCLYKSQEGRYSAFSPYLQLERQKGACITWISTYYTHFMAVLKRSRITHNII